MKLPLLSGRQVFSTLNRKEDKKLTWEETFKSMSEERENWNDFDVTLMDGLEEENPDS